MVLLCGLSVRASSRLNFDFDWRFHLGDAPEASAIEFADRDWRPVDVPHDYSIEADFNRSNVSSTAFLPAGIAWYRKTFVLPAQWAGQRVGIEFDGVSRSSQVWLNGQRLGEHGYGYTPFNFDLTPFLRPDGSNVVAVRVDRDRLDDSRWYPGSGIIRHVWLVAHDSVHVERHGVYVTTPEVARERATVRVRTAVRNETGEAVMARLVTKIVAPDGRRVSLPPVEKTIPADGAVNFDQTNSITNPELWSLQHPALYTVRTVVQSGRQERDVEETPFGIRSIRFNAQNGFYLNGQPVKLHAVCVHQDAGGLGGAAMLDRVWERRLRILRDLGVNTIRCSHNPAPAFFYDLCDRLGLLVIDEAFDEWTGAKRKWVQGWNVGIPSHGAGYSEYFNRWSNDDLREMILRSRNHPSIILWSIGNEIDYPNDPFSYPTEGAKYDPRRPSAKILVDSGAQLAALARQLDPTRPVTAGLANLKTSNATGLADLLDVVGYNYQYSQYATDMAAYPDRKIFGSENGYGPNYYRLTEDNPRVAGQCLWVGIDYLGESKGWPMRGWDDGLLDTCAFLKPRAAYRQSLWSNKPMVYLGVRSASAHAGATSWQGDFGWESIEPHWNWQGDTRSNLPVVAYSNCREVELFLNGRSLGVKEPGTGHVSRWEVPFAAGELKAIGRNAGIEAAQSSLKTAGAPVRLELLPDRRSIAADGEDAAQVEIRALDAQGAIVPMAAMPCTVSVSGAGILGGLDNGDQSDTTRLTSPTRRLHHGRALFLVRSGRQPGQITVKVMSANLPEAQLRLACGQ